jgi:divalent metal cation (Fe/Co/Zn/Cd) transporter
VPLSSRRNPVNDIEVPGHDELLARGRRLQYATIAWNLMEVVVTIGLGVAAASLALIAFGLDSLVEVFASLVVLWYIANHHAEARARRAMRLVAVAFAVLALYLVAASVYNLTQGDAADSSPLGIAYLAVTACVMFGLANTKRRVAAAARSEPLAAEARLTFLDGCLASGILIALVLNAAWGIWWADPAAACLVAAFCAREATDNWRESRSALRLAP